VLGVVALKSISSSEHHALAHHLEIPHSTLSANPSLPPSHHHHRHQLGGLLFGYDIGATSGVLASLTSEKLSGIEW